MARSWFAVQALAPGAADIQIRGIIGDWGLTDRDLIAEMELLGDVAEIALRINSRGGDAAQGLSIFNYLRQHPARVTAYVEGLAASAATIPMMAADRIVMPSNTILMIHNPFYLPEDMPSVTDLERGALALWREALIETYSARAKVDRDALGALLDEQTFMGAAQALALGFCDEVVQVGANAPSALAVMACAAGIPDEVAAQLAAEPVAALVPEAGTDADIPPAAPAAVAEAPPAEGSDSATVLPVLVAPHATLASQIVAAAAELDLAEHAPVFALAADILDATSARAALVQACEVRDLCRAAGMAEHAAGLIRARVPLAQAREQLAATLALAADQLPVSNQLTVQNQAQAPVDRRVSVTTASIYAARKTHR